MQSSSRLPQRQLGDSSHWLLLGFVLVLFFTVAQLAKAEPTSIGDRVPVLAFDESDRAEIFEGCLKEKCLSISADGWDVCVLVPFGKCWHATRVKGKGSLDKGVLVVFARRDSHGQLQPLFPWGRYRGITQSSPSELSKWSDSVFVKPSVLTDVPDNKFLLSSGNETTPGSRFGHFWAVKIGSQAVGNTELSVLPRPVWQSHYCNLYSWIPSSPIEMTTFVSSIENSGQYGSAFHLPSPLPRKPPVPAFRHDVHRVAEKMFFPFVPRRPLAIGDAVTIYVEHETERWVQSCNRIGVVETPFISVVLRQNDETSKSSDVVAEVRLAGVDHFTIRDDRLKFSLQFSGADVVDGEIDAGKVKFLSWPRFVPIDGATIRSTGILVDVNGRERPTGVSDYLIERIAHPSGQPYWYASRSSCISSWDSGLTGYKMSLPNWTTARRKTVHACHEILCGTFEP